jgi:hypothetical protein
VPGLGDSGLLPEALRTPSRSSGATAINVFVSASDSFWTPKADVDCQTLSFSASFYKIRWGENHPKST